MSENGNTFVAFVTGVFIGGILGAMFALLYAPEAGDQLRAKIQSGAQSSWEKAQLELERLTHAEEEQAQVAASPQDQSVDPHNEI